ncbi:hypothetical protein [Chryseobacterium sp. RLHN22]|uniref:hypothetical protein n=1 Tax=Chryseobacterium sp. RLHN22 TaxID=3437885 RepID=UPI003D9B664A
MNKLYPLFFLLLLFSCNDKKPETKFENEIIPNPEEVLRKYVVNPKNDDRICKEDIARAKKDMEKYRNIYVTTSCFGCKSLIYEDEISEYASKIKFKVINYDYSCVKMEGQTQGCYKAFINLEMEKIHGKNFRKKIEKEAEKLLIEKIKNDNKVLNIYDLNENEKPHFVKEDNLIKEGYIPTIKTGLSLKHERDSYPFMDISFIIEKNGRISNLKNKNWVSGFKENEKHKSELENIAKKTILAYYNHWKPGRYVGVIARVENTFRVTFE